MLLPDSTCRRPVRSVRTWRRIRSLLFALALLVASAWAGNRSSPAPNPTQLPPQADGGALGGTLDISHYWLVHGGDESVYASPQFDDRDWQIIAADEAPSVFRTRGQSVIWYRKHVRVPASETSLSLALSHFSSSLEAYVNGVRVGRLGPTGSGASRSSAAITIMKIPQAAVAGGTLVIALRTAVPPSFSEEQAVAGFGSVVLGRSQALQDSAALEAFRDDTASGLILMLQSFALIVLLALTVFLRGQPEYLALTISLSFGVASTLFGFGFVRQALSLPSPLEAMCADALFVGQMLAFIEFFRLIAKDGSGWFRMMQVSLLVFGLVVVTHDALRGTLPHSIEASAAFPVFYLVTTMPYLIGLPAMLLASWIRRRNSDAALLFLPAALFCCYYGARRVIRLLSLWHLTRPFPDRIPIVFLHASWGDLVDIAVTVMLLVYIIFRVVRTLREGARYAAEVQAAHTVQQVLLSQSPRATPGFKVETVYLPASEVGGDFFLVAPDEDGSLVAIVGDVAGKGMLAAMRVSVILGALYREKARLPGTILECLNEAMLRQGDMGMITACCVRVESNGRLVVANAGHISPYLGGQEVATAGALPLGIVPGTKYEQTESFLRPGEQLVLMSDGVVEARSAQGGLFGFERLAPLTRQPAIEIAETAKAFGQEDDITVLTVMCTP